MPTYDLVVYGTTLPALAAAIRFCRLHPTKTAVAIGEWGRTGGMVTGGLTVSDEVADNTIYWGLTEEFFKGIGARYGLTDTYAWRFRASTAQAQLDAMIAAETNLTVVLDEHLVSVNTTTTGSVRKITSIDTDAANYIGTHYVCGNYEADLSAMAGLSVTYGREAASRYDEPFAGVRLDQVDEISTRPTVRQDGGLQLHRGYYPPQETGGADARTMEYNYRLQLTDAAGRIPWPEPPNYDEAFWIRELSPDPRTISQVLSLQDLPLDGADKKQTNFNSIGGQFVYGWPTATHAERVQMKARHYDYFMGTLYYLATGSDRDQAAKDSFALWGFDPDEFQTDFYHIPGMSPELYIREGRRIVGRDVILEQDVLANDPISDPICVGGYFMDRHTVQVYPQADGTGSATEGHIGYSAQQYYPIGFDSIRAPRSVCDNLLTVWGISVSSVVWSSARMEPTLMMVGDAAGIAAARAETDGVTTGALNYADIRSGLDSVGAVYYRPEV